MTVVDVGALRVVETVPVGGNPTYLRAHPQRAEVYVLLADANSVAVLDARSRRVVARIAVGAQPSFLEFAPAGQRAYVANSGS
ncbi:MAG TPA: hypothetical protein VJ085_06415, partial [Candidatus Acidoferrales bacterium]|nr:hypothetical protein [Candidatus Acidoferrales bacterium]